MQNSFFCIYFVSANQLPFLLYPPKQPFISILRKASHLFRIPSFELPGPISSFSTRQLSFNFINTTKNEKDNFNLRTGYGRCFCCIHFLRFFQRRLQNEPGICRIRRWTLIPPTLFPKEIPKQKIFTTGYRSDNLFLLVTVICYNFAAVAGALGMSGNKGSL